MDETEIISELYGLPAGDFTTARNERAAEAKRGGDKALSERIRALKKPTASAWALNMLVRKHPEDIAQLIELGGQMREAQSALAGDQLRELTKQRRQAVAALGKKARQVSAELGAKLSPAAASELEDTLQAALVDPSAAFAVRSGRLTAPLSYVGLGPLSSGPDLEESVAPAPGGLEVVTATPPTSWAETEAWPEDDTGALIWPVPDRIEPTPQARTGTKVVPGRRSPERTAEEARERAAREKDDERRRTELETARRRKEIERAKADRDEAERAADEAAATLREAQQHAERVTAQRKELDARVDELTEELRLAEEEAMRAAKEVLEARHRRDTAARKDMLARRAVERARAAVEHLDE